MPEQPEKFDLHSMNISEEKLKQLKQLLPEVFTEGLKVDFDKLKLTLGENVDVGKERYGMNWPGKADCFKIIQQTSVGTLLPCREESVDFDTTENLFIEGDNLEVLKLLQKSYYGKIKMIYIDPPYNTGHDFVYPDDYSETLDTYLKYTGQVDNEGRKYSTNAETDGRFHSKWMNMMYPRLFLARNLLNEDGLLFISIDNGEVDNCKKICDEIFGPENFIEKIIWKNKFGSGALTKGFANVHEYILCYSKNEMKNLEAPLDETTIKKYTNKDEKYSKRGGYVTQPLATNSKDERPNLRYPIIYKDKEIWPEKQWIWSKERFENALKNNEIIFNENENNINIRIKQYLNDENGNIRKGKPLSILLGPFNQEGTKEIKELFKKNIFGFPKPSNLLKYLCSFIVNSNENNNGIYLDFFSGSGTLAQSILNLNMQDKGNRKFICIQLPEPLEDSSEAFKEGFLTISDIGKERIRRFIKKIKAEQEGTKDLFFKDKPEMDLGFKVLKLDRSNFKLWNTAVEKSTPAISQQLEAFVEHIDSSRTREDILYELLLKSGFPLTTKIEKKEISGQVVYSIAEGALFICLEDQLTTELIKVMAELKPMQVICLDSGFHGNDQLKTNAVQIFKSHDISFKTV